jgi:hypothetical protein
MNPFQAFLPQVFSQRLVTLALPQVEKKSFKTGFES